MTHCFGSTLLKSLGRSRYTSANPDTANKMRRMIIINPSIPPIVSAAELFTVEPPLGSIIVVAISVQTALAVYDPQMAETQQL